MKSKNEFKQEDVISFCVANNHSYEMEKLNLIKMVKRLESNYYHNMINLLVRMNCYYFIDVISKKTGVEMHFVMSNFANHIDKILKYNQLDIENNIYQMPNLRSDINSYYLSVLQDIYNEMKINLASDLFVKEAKLLAFSSMFSSKNAEEIENNKINQVTSLCIDITGDIKQHYKQCLMKRDYKAKWINDSYRRAILASFKTYDLYSEEAIVDFIQKDTEKKLITENPTVIEYNQTNSKNKIVPTTFRNRTKRYY